MTKISRHYEWLSLLEMSGPFLSVSVLEKAFPQGLDLITTKNRQHIRAAYEEWGEAVEGKDPVLSDLHHEWVKLILNNILEYGDEVLKKYNRLDESIALVEEKVGYDFAPDYIIKGESDDKPRLLISIQEPNTDLLSVQNPDGSILSLMERMTTLCSVTGVNLGLLTNGEQWMLVYRLSGDVTGHVSWFSRLWFQEIDTFRSFQTLLGVRRSFGPSDVNLETLLTESLNHNQEITETLGEQVRRAVEVLVQALDKADEDRNRKLLKNVPPEELYSAGLTVMMRLVFVLCAEERGLLLLGDPTYDQFYAISNLRSQLEEEVDTYGAEVLERRHDAWARLLTVFRAVYGGIEHEALRLPPLGGTLFDPDKFPFLEGREQGSDWTKDLAKPIPVDNRTVLLLLNSLQVLEQGSGAMLLSYKGLDVEQIGHVYEGLLEYQVIRVPEITLGLSGTHKVPNPNVSLSKLESYKEKNEKELIKYIEETTGRSSSAINNLLSVKIGEREYVDLVKGCGGDIALAERIKPYSKLLRKDAWGSLIIFKKGSFIVTLGLDRRDTGTHYTPKSLTETIISKTLEPLVYLGPGEGKDRSEWQIKSPSEILNLKVCDPAMGSGAFLVQACRWLGQRVVESWAKAESEGKMVGIDGQLYDTYEKELMPSQIDERLLIAKRIIAEKCLYGVDLNPMAVELAKLSIWLVTLSKGRPFGFLDHNFRCGDSLLGIYHIDQLKKLNLDPNISNEQLNLFGSKIKNVVNEVMALRNSIRSITIIDINDVKTMVSLNQEADKKMKNLKLIADAIVGEALLSGGNIRVVENKLDDLSMDVEGVLEGNAEIKESLKQRINHAINQVSVNSKLVRKPFHWSLEFPEVFTSDEFGFDAVVGNPPFIGGRRMRGALGDEMINWLSTSWPHASMNADYSAFFFLRAGLLLKNIGHLGLLGTNTISQGDTARTGLSYLFERFQFTIRYGISSFNWPGKATVTAALVIGCIGNWNGIKQLNGTRVEYISQILDDQEGWGQAKKLKNNKKKCFQGSVLRGTGFILTKEEAAYYIRQNSTNQEVIFPYINGEDLNSKPEQTASRMVIDFRDKSLDICEKRWPTLLERIRGSVKTKREESRRKGDKFNWWQHWRIRADLYNQLQERDWVLAISGVTKYVAIAKVSAKQVFSHAVFVFDMPTWSGFASLQCTFHDIWVRRGSSTMGETLRYTPTDYFETYPLLNIYSDKLDLLGKQYHDYRKKVMQSNGEGLTTIYNRFHDSEDNTEEILILRELHEEMDKQVARDARISDIKLEHGFHETKLGMRFTISEAARREVLKRLLSLNQEMYEKEKQQNKLYKKVTKRHNNSLELDGQLDLFSEDISLN